MAVTAPAALASPGRALAHFIGVASGWVLFVLGWQRVAARPWDSHELWVLIVASSLVLPMLTVIWIAHNIGLYRRRSSRRRQARVVEARYESDWTGRVIEARWSGLAQANRIHIDVGTQSKRYRAVPGGALAGASGSASAPDEGIDTQAPETETEPVGAS